MKTSYPFVEKKKILLTIPILQLSIVSVVVVVVVVVVEEVEVKSVVNPYSL